MFAAHPSQPVFCELSGDLDCNTAPIARAKLWPQFVQADGVVVVDCSDLTFLASAGVQLLVDADRELRLRSTRLVLRNVPGGRPGSSASVHSNAAWTRRARLRPRWPAHPARRPFKVS